MTSKQLLNVLEKHKIHPGVIANIDQYGENTDFDEYYSEDWDGEGDFRDIADKKYGLGENTKIVDYLKHLGLGEIEIIKEDYTKDQEVLSIVVLFKDHDVILKATAETYGSYRAENFTYEKFQVVNKIEKTVIVYE